MRPRRPSRRRPRRRRTRTVYAAWGTSDFNPLSVLPERLLLPTGTGRTVYCWAGGGRNWSARIGRTDCRCALDETQSPSTLPPGSCRGHDRGRLRTSFRSSPAPLYAEIGLELNSRLVAPAGSPLGSLVFRRALAIPRSSALICPSALRSANTL